MPSLKRREFLTGMAAGAAVIAAPGGAKSEPAWRRTSSQPKTRAQAPSGGLAEPAFRPLPLGSVLPQGWLLRQLRQQADGLSGHLDEFWPDVNKSQWFGGPAEGWERAP